MRPRVIYALSRTFTVERHTSSLNPRALDAARIASTLRASPPPPDGARLRCRLRAEVGVG